MKIYIDFDDCLCETARYFSVLVKEMFGKDVPYEDIGFFDLKRSFALTDEQYEEMMIKAHTPEALLAFEETPGASETVNSFIDAGHEVSIITGRPNIAYEASRQWLDQHGLQRVKLYCLNKYGRDSFIKNSECCSDKSDHFFHNFFPRFFMYFVLQIFIRVKKICGKKLIQDHILFYGLPVKTPFVAASRKFTFMIPGTVVDHDLKIRQMIKKLKGQRRILDGIVKMHLVVILKLKAELTVLNKTVPSVFI